MKVVAGGAAGRAHAADLLAASDMITLVHQNGGHVSVAGRDAAAMVDLDEIAVAATVPAGMNNGAVGSGVDRGAVGAGKIDARMEGGACAERDFGAAAFEQAASAPAAAPSRKLRRESMRAKLVA